MDVRLRLDNCYPDAASIGSLSASPNANILSAAEGICRYRARIACLR